MSFVQQLGYPVCVVSNVQDLIRAKDTVQFHVEGPNLILRLETNKTSNRAKIELDENQARQLLRFLQERLK